MQTSSFDFKQTEFLSIFDNPLLPSKVSSLSHRRVYRRETRAHNRIQGSFDVAFSNYTVNDYRVGTEDTLHATMVYEFLRLFCQEESSKQAADAVAIVNVQGCIRGYGGRHDSAFGDLFERWYGCLITEILSESLKRQWLNQNIECLALQRRHWRLFRLYDAAMTPMVLMEFHPLELQRTALVLWMLED